MKLYQYKNYDAIDRISHFYYTLKCNNIFFNANKIHKISSKDLDSDFAKWNISL